MNDESDAPARPPRLLDQVNDAVRRKHYSRRTEEAHVHWIKRFIFFSDERHSRDSALLFLYKEVLGQPLPWLDQIDRAKPPGRGEPAGPDRTAAGRA